jgi:hypothetical protein
LYFNNFRMCNEILHGIDHFRNFQAFVITHTCLERSGFTYLYPVSADGMIFPCGWLHDRLFGPEVESTSDHMMMKTMLSRIGGSLQANCQYRDLEVIVNGKWFRLISQSWGGQTRTLLGAVWRLCQSHRRTEPGHHL